MTPPMLPPKRPELTAAEVVALARAAGVDTAKPFMLGRRGYYRDTMGAVGANDIGVYDDAVFYVSPTLFLAANANTDPSREQPGMATLAAGVWPWTRVIHNLSKDPALHPHYPAFGQAADVIVHRWGTDAVAAGTRDARGHCLGAGKWQGAFAIHLHKGGHTTTGSEGCQTVPPEQWDAPADFYAQVDRDLRAHGVTTWPYILTIHAE